VDVTTPLKRPRDRQRRRAPRHPRSYAMLAFCDTPERSRLRRPFLGPSFDDASYDFILRVFRPEAIDDKSLSETGHFVSVAGVVHHRTSRGVFLEVARRRVFIPINCMSSPSGARIEARAGAGSPRKRA
jgi:hypothetical protein